MRAVPFAVLLLLVAGCATKTEVTTLVGSGGTVSMGDTLDQAKKAFPAPDGAEMFDTSMTFTDHTPDGWGWGVGEGTGFEAAVKDGKIVGLAETRLDGPPDKDAIEQQIKALGEPTRKAEGESAAMLVWESGANARFFLVLKGGNPIFGAGTITVIGDKEQMKMLNYHYDDPDTFVKQMDATYTQFADSNKDRN